MTHPVFITLTVPRFASNPRNGITTIRKYFNLLRKTKLFSKVKGGAYQIEVKIKPDGYHIHIHAILDSPFMPYQLLFSAWRKITGVQVPQVDVRSADSIAAKTYIAKYTAKSAGYENALDQVVEWYQATKGLRLFTTFGTFYNATLESLDPTTIEKPYEVHCPHCNAIKSVFRARDGPWKFPKEIRKEMIKTINSFGDQTRPITIAQDVESRNYTQEEVTWINQTIDQLHPTLKS
jgi:hypothetical protein